MYTKEEIIRMVYLQHNVTGTKKMNQAIEFAISKMMSQSDDVIMKGFKTSTGNDLVKINSNRFQITF
jgi:hypothetical protein